MGISALQLEEKMKFKTISMIRHCGKNYPPGTPIELNDEEVARLLATDSIEPIHKPFSAEIVMPSDAVFRRPD